MRVGTPTSSGLPLRAATVLVVEDESLVRTAITEYLRDSGYGVMEASNVEAAIGVLQSQKIDVVFSDILLPGGLSGFDLANELKARWPTVPVLLTSGYFKPVAETPVELTVIKKPYTLASVEHHIRLLLRSSTGRSSLP